MLTEVSGSVLDYTMPGLIYRQGRRVLRRHRHAMAGIEGIDGKFLPGLTSRLKAVGKVTSRITTKLAKAGARIVGIPPEAIDALAKLDPLKKGSVTSILASGKLTNAQKAEQLKALGLSDTVADELSKGKVEGAGEIPKNYLYIGGAVLAGIVVLSFIKK